MPAFRAVIESNGKTATGIEVPTGVVEALGSSKRPKVRLSYSRQRWFVEGIEGAKKPETRQRRIDQAVARLAEGRGER